MVLHESHFLFHFSIHQLLIQLSLTVLRNPSTKTEHLTKNKTQYLHTNASDKTHFISK